MTGSARPTEVVVNGAFDDLGSRQLRFLEEAARLGPVTVLLWGDSVIHDVIGKPPKFPLAEREYVLRAVRYVSRVEVITNKADTDALPEAADLRPAVWAVRETEHAPAKAAYCAAHNVQYHIVADKALAGFPEPPPAPAAATRARKKVVVTGCYDWVHSGHVRFFEEVSSYGDLYVIVGHDANIRLLKGEGHPLFPEEERRYLVGSIRHVAQALVSSGEGWLDADPEIRRLKPDIYAVNEDGDKGGKREYCASLGIEYLVLKRLPAPGLQPRTSTDLRGF